MLDLFKGGAVYDDSDDDGDEEKTRPAKATRREKMRYVRDNAAGAQEEEEEEVVVKGPSAGLAFAAVAAGLATMASGSTVAGTAADLAARYRTAGAPDQQLAPFDDNFQWVTSGMEAGLVPHGYRDGLVLTEPLPAIAGTTLTSVDMNEEDVRPPQGVCVEGLADRVISYLNELRGGKCLQHACAAAVVYSVFVPFRRVFISYFIFTAVFRLSISSPLVCGCRCCHVQPPCALPPVPASAA